MISCYLHNDFMPYTPQSTLLHYDSMLYNDFMLNIPYNLSYYLPYNLPAFLPYNLPAFLPYILH